MTRSNLSVANEQRDYKIFEEFAYAMIDRARICSQTDTDFTLDIAGPVYAFDSTVIDLCLSVFWWAEFRTTKAAVKIHTLLDVKTSIPCFVHITNRATHDVHGLDVLKYETGGFYVLDPGYMDFERLFKINLCGAYFVTRAKDNLNFARITSRKVKRKKVLSVTRLSNSGAFILQKNIQAFSVEYDSLTRKQKNDSYSLPIILILLLKISYCFTSTDGRSNFSSNA